MQLRKKTETVKVIFSDQSTLKLTLNIRLSLAITNLVPRLSKYFLLLTYFEFGNISFNMSIIKLYWISTNTIDNIYIMLIHIFSKVWIKITFFCMRQICSTMSKNKTWSSTSPVSWYYRKFIEYIPLAPQLKLYLPLVVIQAVVR